MFLATHATGIEDTVAGRQITERHEAWTKRMPSEPAKLWAFIMDLSECDRLNLRAYCVA
jgi:ParB family chromosome partitioning protein